MEMPDSLLSVGTDADLGGSRCAKLDNFTRRKGDTRNKFQVPGNSNIYSYETVRPHYRRIVKKFL